MQLDRPSSVTEIPELSDWPSLRREATQYTGKYVRLHSIWPSLPVFLHVGFASIHNMTHMKILGPSYSGSGKTCFNNWPPKKGRDAATGALVCCKEQLPAQSKSPQSIPHGLSKPLQADLSLKFRC